MVILSGLTSIFQSRKDALITYLIMLILVIVAIYDSTLIIDTFVNDNLVTLVKTVDIGENDTLPYLENLYWKTNLDFELIFPDPKNLFDKIDTSLEEEVLNGSFSLGNVNVSDPKDRARLVAIFTKLLSIDESAIACAGSPNCFYADRENYDWISNFTRDLAALDRLERKLWSIIGPDLFLYDASPNQSECLFHEPLTRIGLNAELATYRVLKGNPATFTLRFGARGHWEAMVNASSPVSIEFSTKSTAFEAVELSEVTTDDFCVIDLKIDNIGVFNRSETTQCGNEEDIVISGLTTKHPRVFLEAFVKECGCVPFSYKRHYYAIAGSDVQHHPPICDVETYFRCTNRTIVERNILPPCVKSKNQYQFSVHCLDGSKYQCSEETSSEGFCPLFTLNLKSNADLYAVYAERYQLTVTQFVSQLGGDIGLYTGLSILSIWQLLLYLYNKYSAFKSSYERQSSENKGFGSSRVAFYKSFAISLFKNLGAAEEEDHHRQAGELREKPSDQRLTKMESNLDGVEDLAAKNSERLEAMETGLEKIKQTFERLESLAMETQRAVRDILGRSSSKENKDHDKEADTDLTTDSARNFDHRLPAIENGVASIKSALKSSDGKKAKEDHEQRFTRIEKSLEVIAQLLAGQSSSIEGSPLAGP